jgi:hypothetical protein
LLKNPSPLGGALEEGGGGIGRISLANRQQTTTDNGRQLKTIGTVLSAEKMI